MQHESQSTIVRINLTWALSRAEVKDAGWPLLSRFLLTLLLLFWILLCIDCPDRTGLIQQFIDDEAIYQLGGCCRSLAFSFPQSPRLCSAKAKWLWWLSYHMSNTAQAELENFIITRSSLQHYRCFGRINILSLFFDLHIWCEYASKWGREITREGSQSGSRWCTVILTGAE